MNDFTKSELKSLLWAIIYVRDRTNNCGDIMRSLRSKIQSMIYNYCEHEKTKGCEECYTLECKQCGQCFSAERFVELYDRDSSH